LAGLWAVFPAFGTFFLAFGIGYLPVKLKKIKNQKRLFLLLLGHADMSATTIYAHVSDQIKMQAAARLPFVSIVKRKLQAPLTEAA
jgi:hypothetical protein